VGTSLDLSREKIEAVFESDELVTVPESNLGALSDADASRPSWTRNTTTDPPKERRPGD
jgi:hypothetical protein